MNFKTTINRVQRWTKPISLALLLCLLCGQFARVSAQTTSDALLAQEKTIQFSGYTWVVTKGGCGGKGPASCDPNNVWVDANGYLHLRLTRVGKKWRAAEIYSTQRFGFGSYQWQVIGRIDQLDRNVVLGLFNYPPADVGPDATNEIDIEFARWGNAASPNLNYTVYPAVEGLEASEDMREFALNGTYSTHRFNWRSDQIFFQSLHGHVDDNSNQFHSWPFAPSDPLQQIPQNPLPIYMNLWLFKKSPANGQNVEIVIKKFTYTPANILAGAHAPTEQAGAAANQEASEFVNHLFLPTVLNQ